MIPCVSQVYSFNLFHSHRRVTYGTWGIYISKKNIQMFKEDSLKDQNIFVKIKYMQNCYENKLSLISFTMISHRHFILKYMRYTYMYDYVFLKNWYDRTWLTLFTISSLINSDLGVLLQPAAKINEQSINKNTIYYSY